MDLGGLGDKAKKALDSEKGEKMSDQALERGEQFADDRTGGKYDAQTDKAGDKADDLLGRRDT
ncbi:antitoxin [Blastococcus sp. URHD0036]|uniref:antitoxin n=1 Tax=Blastococcus sp. URHD0036 TaxID=1380356 RepID=UPI0004970659|nr:antitoxin [Blastococcus sp. URHD0036]